MKKNEFYSYVYDFISQIMDNKKISESIIRIILFGSIARGDFHKKSDIDLFIEITNSKEKETKQEINNEINKFEERAKKSWFLRGIDLPIKAIVGNLDNKRWADLKEELSSYGIVLYGRFTESPEKLKHKILINYDLKKLVQKNKMSFLRKLYGYKIKKPNKEYLEKGIIDDISGQKLGPNFIIISPESLLEIKKILKKFKIQYQIRDLWIK